jgi:hypothetical protein
MMALSLYAFVVGDVVTRRKPLEPLVRRNVDGMTVIATRKWKAR